MHELLNWLCYLHDLFCPHFCITVTSHERHNVQRTPKLMPFLLPMQQIFQTSNKYPHYWSFMKESGGDGRINVITIMRKVFPFHDDVIKWKKIRVNGPLWGISTGHRWIPVSQASEAELWCFLWSAPEQTVEQTIETSVIWDAIVAIRSSLQWSWRHHMCLKRQFPLVC